MSRTWGSSLGPKQVCADPLPSLLSTWWSLLPCGPHRVPPAGRMLPYLPDSHSKYGCRAQCPSSVLQLLSLRPQPSDHPPWPVPTHSHEQFSAIKHRPLHPLHEFSVFVCHVSQPAPLLCQATCLETAPLKNASGHNIALLAVLPPSLECYNHGLSPVMSPRCPSPPPNFPAFTPCL